MEFFPSVKRNNQEVLSKLELIVSENEILRGVVVRSEAQISTLIEQMSLIKDEVARVGAAVSKMFDGSSSFSFQAGPQDKVRGYRLYPDYGADIKIEELSPEDQNREIKRRAIASKLYEYASLRGLSTSEKSIGVLYRPMYEKLEVATGYKANRKAVFKYRDPQPRTICAVIDDGYADTLGLIIDQEIAKLKEESTLPTRRRRGRPKKTA